MNGSELTSDVLDVALVPARRVTSRGATLAWVLAGCRPQLWFGLLWTIALLVQLAHGAYSVGLGNHSDEAAHFMNALVLRDYLTTAFGTDPLAFAQQYYLHYPKIAPFVWPPLFHATLGLFLLPGWSPQTAALVFLSLLAAATAYRLSTFAALIQRGWTTWLLPIAFLLVPLVVDASSIVMVDLAVAMTALEATWWLNRYIARPSLRNAVWFGAWAAACCLAKGNGASVVLVAPIALVIGRQLSLLKQRGLYIAGLLVAVLAGPFVYISYRVCAAMGDFTGRSLVDLEHRLQYVGAVLWTQLTPIPIVLSGLAAVTVAVYGDRNRRRVDREAEVAPVTLLALALAGVMFHVLLPLDGLEPRYMTMAIAPLMALVPLGAGVLAGLSPQRWRNAATSGLVAFGLATFVMLRPAPHERQSSGFKEVIAPLPTSALAGARLLVVSDTSGEGALVSGVASRGPEPMATVIRASKLLVDEDWMGANSRNLFGSPSDTLRTLEDLHVQYLVVDMSSDARELPYWSHVQDVLAVGGEAFVRVGEVERVGRLGRPIVTYRLMRQSPGPAKALQANVRYFGPGLDP